MTESDFSFKQKALFKLIKAFIKKKSGKDITEFSEEEQKKIYDKFVEECNNRGIH